MVKSRCLISEKPTDFEKPHLKLCFFLIDDGLLVNKVRCLRHLQK